MTTHNFYIEKHNNDKNEIIIRPDFPIMCNGKERLSVKLVDFKYLNSSYNISSALHNNVVSVSSFVPQRYFNSIDSIFFGNQDLSNPIHNIGTSTFLDVSNSYSTLGTNEKSIVGSDYAVYWGSVVNFLNYTPNKTNFRDGYNNNYLGILDGEYFKIHKINTNTWVSAFILEAVFIKMTILIGTAPETINITFGVDGSNDNITYTPLPVSLNILTIPEYSNGGEITLNVDAGVVPYKYYKVKVLSHNNTSVDNFKLLVDKILFYKAGMITTNINETTTQSLITIPDGFYNIDNLITKFNSTPNIKIALAKQDFTNKIIVSNSVPIQIYENPYPYVDTPITTSTEIRTLIFQNNLTANMYGFNDRLVPLASGAISNTYCNIMNFSKIIISTNLAFSTSTENDIPKDGSPYSHFGIGNILEWVDADEIPMSCIKYKNIENITHKLDNRYINEFKLIFCNEKSLPLVLDNMLFHLQIIKNKK